MFETICYTEAPCQIKTPLQDVETTETETITLVVETTKPRKVTWFKNNQPITASDRFLISLDDTGLRHTLTIANITLDEDAEFTVQIDDNEYGVISSSAKVTVKGVYYFQQQQQQ